MAYIFRKLFSIILGRCASWRRRGAIRARRRAERKVVRNGFRDFNVLNDFNDFNDLKAFKVSRLAPPRRMPLPYALPHFAEIRRVVAYFPPIFRNFAN